MKKLFSINTFLLCAALFYVFMLPSCTLDDNEPDYGVLEVTTDGGYLKKRSVHDGEINSATITISGTGMDTIVEETNLEKKEIIEIPVGKNRLVRVELEKTVENKVQKKCAVLSAVTNIESGTPNYLTVDWETTKVGRVFEELLNLDYDVSNLDKEQVRKYLPDIHAYLIDAAALARDIKSGNIKKSESYKLKTSTLEFSIKNSYLESKLSIQVCDPTSKTLENFSGGNGKIENIAPGEWDFYVIMNGVVVYSKKISLEAGKTVSIDESGIKITGLGFTYPKNSNDNFYPEDINKDAIGFGWDSEKWEPGASYENSILKFAVYSEHAEKILLEIYEEKSGKDAKYHYWMEKGNDNYWRAALKHSSPNGVLYGFRCWGPNWPYRSAWDRGDSLEGFITDCDENGNRFNPNKVLFDPYAKELSHDKSTPGVVSNGGAFASGPKNRKIDTGTFSPKGIVIIDSTSYGRKPHIPQKDAIIYESHVRGLTQHESSSNLRSILDGMEGFEGVENIPPMYRGTYKGAGLMAKYLKALGINTIELLPIHESDNDANDDLKYKGQFWGYMTFGYFAPDRRYSHDKSFGGPTKEFKEMVKAFHDEGMEVYIDVVYNHTGEGGMWKKREHDSYREEEFPESSDIFFLRGFDNSVYYSLVRGNQKYFWDTSGCGSNVRCDHFAVRKLILDSLTYWIEEMGVDGFRFDLAPVLGRELKGDKWEFNTNAKTITDIAALGQRTDTEMIAEAWDLGGLFIGKFPYGWGEWNGRFRDTLRRYIGKGYINSDMGNFNNYMNGDYDVFSHHGGPHKSVNFVVAHDGNTLADLCCYTKGGEEINKQFDWPFGPSVGGTTDPNHTDFGQEPKDVRQAARNYTAIQMVSRGVPMIVYGDELCRTQNGNNNPHNLDSIATWNNYNMINTNAPQQVSAGEEGKYEDKFGVFGSSKNGNFVFMQRMLNLRKAEPAFRQDNYHDVRYEFKKADGVNNLDGSDCCSWIYIHGSSVLGGSDYLVFINMWKEKVSFNVPSLNDSEWKKIADTAEYAEKDYNSWLNSPSSVDKNTYSVHPWSVVILRKDFNNKPAPYAELNAHSTKINVEEELSVNVLAHASGNPAPISYTIYESSRDDYNGREIKNGIFDDSLKIVFKADTSKVGIKYYYCKIRGGGKESFSKKLKIEVAANLPSVKITADKDSPLEIFADEQIILTANAVQGKGNTGSLFYKWFKYSANEDPVEIPSASGKTYRIIAQNEGNGAKAYYCEVTSSAGSVKSNVIEIFIKAAKDAPSVFVEYDTPLDKPVKAGTTVTLKANAHSVKGGFTYEWYSKNDSSNKKIEGADKSIFTPSTENEGTYYYLCKVKDSSGQTAESNIVKLNIEEFRVTVYFKVPSWEPPIGEVTISLNGNGHSWESSERNRMYKCNEENWYKYTFQVEDKNKPIAYQPRMNQYGSIKYMKKPANINQDAVLENYSKFIIIDASNDSAKDWQDNNWCFKNENDIKFTSEDPKY